MEWGLARISSRELTEWMMLAKIEAEEREERALAASSSDGQVVISRRGDLPEAEWEDDGGSAE